MIRENQNQRKFTINEISKGTEQTNELDCQRKSKSGLAGYIFIFTRHSDMVILQN